MGLSSTASPQESNTPGNACCRGCFRFWRSRFAAISGIVALPQWELKTIANPAAVAERQGDLHDGLLRRPRVGLSLVSFPVSRPAPMTQSPTDRPAVGSNPAPPSLTPLRRDEGKGRDRMLGLGVLAAILIAGWLTRGYWMPNSWLYSSRTEAPRGFSWLELGTTRQQVLQKLAAEGGQWSSIVKPGMAPSAWAAHSKASLGGRKLDEFAVIYSDAGTYNYGAIPGQGDGPLNASALAPAGSDTAKVVGIRWKAPRTFTEANSAIPAGAVMAELGLPHSEEKDILPNGKVYLWKWPGVNAKYITLEGVVILEQTEELAKVNQAGGKGNLPSMAPPVSEEPSLATGESNANPAAANETSKGEPSSDPAPDRLPPQAADPPASDSAPKTPAP